MGMAKWSDMWVMYCGYLLNFHFNFKWWLIRWIYNNQIMTESEIAGYFYYWPTEEQKKPVKVPFFYGDNSIGRHIDNRIIIPDQGTSKYHGKLKVQTSTMTYIDLGGRNGTKINNNSEDNILSPETQVDVFDGTTLYLGEIKCKIQRLPFKDNEETLPTAQRPKKNIATQQIFKMVFSDDNEEVIKLNPKNNAKNKEDEVNPKQNNITNIEIDQFSISDDFNGMNRKEKNKNSKKQKDNKETKKTGKSIKQEKPQTKEQHRKSEQHQQNKKKQKKESLEKPKHQKSLDKDNKGLKQDKVDKAPIKDNKNIKKQKPKQTKQEKIEPVDKNQRKSKEKQELKKKQAQKEEQLKKEELLKKQEIKKKEKQQQKPKENKKNTDKSISKQKDKKKSKQKQTDTEVEQVDALLNVPRRNLRSTNAKEKVQQGHDTKRRVSQHRKRLPSEMVISDLQFYPLRKSFMNKRVLISGFVPNLTKKYFCIVDKIQDEFDYLVMKEYKRTFKALYAICRGINILRYEWIKDSEFLQKTLKPDGYIFKEFEFIYHSIEKANEGFRVFRGLQFYLGSDEYHLKIQDIQALIYAGGGEMMKKIGKLSPKEKESKNKIAIIRNLDEKNHKIHEEELKRIRKVGFDEIYSIEMVLDSCQKQEIDWAKNKFNPK